MKTPAVKRRNCLIVAFRKWHTWLGIAAALFILVAGFSGIILNYKKPIFTALGIEKEMEKMKEEGGKKEQTPFSTQSGFQAAKISPESALEIARQQWGNVPLERIELKDEQGELVYKIKQTTGEELWVNASTGTSLVKKEYEKLKPGPGGAHVSRFDWGKLVLDLHTGKIGGETGKALMSMAALVLLFLTGSGIYLWIKPLLIRRQNGKSKAAPVKPESAPVGVPHFAATEAS